MSYNSSMTKSYNRPTTVVVRWHRPIVYQGLIKLISKLSHCSLSQLTFMQCMVYFTNYKHASVIGLHAARRPRRGKILHRPGNQ